MDDSTVAVLAFDRISPFHLAVPCTVLGEDRRAAGVPQGRVLVCAAERGPLRTTAGFRIGGLRGLGSDGEKHGVMEYWSNEALA